MKEQEDKSPDHEGTPQWLQTIQLNSWEAELLISALVLYALFQVPDYLDRLALTSFGRGSDIHGLFSIAQRAIQLLSAGYILHILVRGVWVATVGFSYVFPRGVEVDKLKFKGKFRKELSSNGSLVKNVLRLEELSSIIYGISFILFGTLLGFGIFIFSFVYFMELVSPLMKDNYGFTGFIGFLMMFYFLLTLVVFIDFLTNGLFRRKSWAVDWFYPVAVFFRVITLSFLYRKSMLVLISNLKGWRAYLVPILVLGVTVGFVLSTRKMKAKKRLDYLESTSDAVYTGMNYENTRSNNDLLIATIQSDIVQQNTLKLFLNDLKIFTTINVHDMGIKEKWKNLESKEISARLNKWLEVNIDGRSVPNVRWFKSQHGSTYQFGFVAFLDISDLERGEHNVAIRFKEENMKERAFDQIVDEGYAVDYLTNIYFIYDKL